MVGEGHTKNRDNFWNVFRHGTPTADDCVFSYRQI